MTPQQWRRIEELFEAAVDLAPGERAAFLDDACAGDSALRKQVEAMLASDGSSSTAIRGIVEGEALLAAGAPAKPTTGSQAAGRHFGPWLITGLVERGDSSAVYRAVRDDDHSRRPVDLRIFDRGAASDGARARFHQQWQTLARLEHSHIARLMEGGEARPAVGEGSTPYLVSEHVDGVSITEYCAGRRLSISERLRLFLPVCDAVEYAHRRAVVHRHLNPSNVLVTPDGTPKVLHLGVAALSEGDLSMGECSAISAGPDLYSLGEVLYEILSGTKVARGRNPAETRRAASARGDRQLPDDLDAIVVKALQNPPGEPYLSVEQFSRDIRCFLAGFPVSARQATVLYRARKFAARNRLPLAAAILTAGGLIAGTVAVLRERQRSEQRQRDLTTLASVYLSQLDQNSGNFQTRDTLLVNTLHYLDGVAPDGDGDLAFQSKLAQAYERVGEIQEMNERPNPYPASDGLESYRKSLRLRRAVAAANPRNIYATRALAQCLARLGDLCLARADVAGARRYVGEALKTEEQVVRGRKPDLPDLRLLAAGNEELSEIEGKDGNVRSAVGAARQAVEWRQRCAQLDASIAARHDLARDWGRLGRLEQIAGELDGGRRSLLAERELHEAIARQSPDDTANLADLAATAYHLGLVSGGEGVPSLREHTAARRYFEDAISMGERLLKADAHRLALQSAMPDRYGALANLLRDSQTTEAIALYRKAVAAADRLPAGPEDEARLLHARWSSQLSYALRRSGQADEARKTAEAALALMLELDMDHADPRDCRLVSQVYRAVGAAALDARDFAAAREAYSKSWGWMERYLDRARNDLELAGEISSSWEGLELSLRNSGDRDGAWDLHERRLAFWRAWAAQMPSPYTKWQWERAIYFLRN